MVLKSRGRISVGKTPPAAFVVCWTPDACETEAARGRDTGGTGQAIALADRHGIPVFNLAGHDAGERLLAFLKADRETLPKQVPFRSQRELSKSRRNEVMASGFSE